MRGFSGTFVVMMALNSCSDHESQAAAVTARDHMPAAVQQMVDTTLPADGEIHVLSRGGFVVNPDTMFCRSRIGFGLDGEMLRTALRELGQADYLNGSPRGNGIIGESPGCKKGNPIFLGGIQMPNRDGKPYKLILAVWQGNVANGGGAYWTGSVERANTSWDDKSIGYVGDDNPTKDQYEQRVIDRSAFNDVKALGQRFLSKLTKEVGLTKRGQYI